MKVHVSLRIICNYQHM